MSLGAQAAPHRSGVHAVPLRDRAHCWFVAFVPSKYITKLLTIRVPGASASHLDDLTIKALLTCTVIFLTTTHCQDFKDVAGDAAVGRVTFPMVHPFLSRLSYMFFVIFWSIALSVYWELEYVLAAAFIGFSIFIGAFVMMFRTVKADQLSFLLYEVSDVPYYDYY